MADCHSPPVATMLPLRVRRDKPMSRPRFCVRLLAGTVTAVLASSWLAVDAVPAAAAPQRGLGVEVTPAQPYKGNPDPSDWIGSYLVGGKQVWCVRFAFLAPDSDEQYKPGEALKTKWGDDLSEEVAANISYLLLKYAKTTSADDAAAL